jgi:2-polyprenyl-6-methoxyphenol hydroxylase-like FAD-dependent oxidoreductase
MTTTSADVVGAGPVGLVAASEFARRGVNVRFIDKRVAPTGASRAIWVHARSLDMFDRIGIADELVATGIKTNVVQIYGGRKKLFRVPLASVDSAFRFALTTAQTETERVLGEHLQSAGVAVERGVELIGLSQDDAAVHLRLRHPDGSIEEASASWVIGADGAASTVREQVGTQLEGTFGHWRWILGDVDADHHLDVDTDHTYLSADGPVVVLPMREGRIRFLAELQDTPATAPNPEPTLDELQEIIDRRIGGIRLLRAHWLSYFQIHHAQVPAYRWGQVFLAGDAAHLHSPAGGQGMNTGMQDAFNLAWKLAAVIHGDAGDTLLDSYNAERYPVAQQVIRFTTQITWAGALTGLARRIRDAVIGLLSHIGAARQAMANASEEININYKASPIAVGQRPRHAKVAAGEHLPDVRDPVVYKQLRAVLSADNLGQTVITIASDRPAPPAGANGETQVLVARDNTPVPGYDTVIADPTGCSPIVSASPKAAAWSSAPTATSAPSPPSTTPPPSPTTSPGLRADPMHTNDIDTQPVPAAAKDAEGGQACTGPEMVASACDRPIRQASMNTGYVNRMRLPRWRSPSGLA